MSSLRAQAAKAKSKAVQAKAEAFAKAENDPSTEDKSAELENAKDAEDLRNPDVVTKYKLAGEMANKALDLVKAACVAGSTCIEICEFGDKFILEETAKVYNKAGIEKGIAFPTCISVNEVVGHYSPMAGEDERTLQAGDVVKIDLGVHVDGYIAVGATTVVVAEVEKAGMAEVKEDENKAAKADLLHAVNTAAELAIRLMKPGNTSTQVSDMLAKVAREFGVKQVNGIKSHALSRFVIDGEKVIQNKPGVEGEKREKVITFEANEVYAVDLLFTTGEGASNDGASRTTVYKRQVDTTYKLKMKASRAIFSDISQNYPTFPFTIRNLDEKKVRFGIVECQNHDLVTAFPVMEEKKGDLVAHIKFTCLLMPSGTIRLTTTPLELGAHVSEKKLEDNELRKLMQTSYGKKKRKKKKNKKKKAAAQAE